MARVVGINGFGRVGKAILRIALEKNVFEVAVINDINPDNHNLAYLLKYDSLYGTLKDEIKADAKGLFVDGKRIFVYHEKSIEKVPWEKHGVSRVIDASGVHENVVKARELKGRVKQVILTHSPAEHLVDKFVIMGINQDEVNIGKDLIISNSICDANALGPVLNVLHREYGVEYGAVTTLHPWLQYQNLLDGSMMSFAYPGHVYSHYVLGRASPMNILPKPTTTVSATARVLKWLDGKFFCFSYRVPTPCVSSSDITVKLRKKATVEDIKRIFHDEEKKQKFKVFRNNFEPLVSIDFKGSEYSCIIDQRWTHVYDENHLKLILWYDNEWGYSAKCVELAAYLFDKEAKGKK